MFFLLKNRPNSMSLMHMHAENEKEPTKEQVCVDGATFRMMYIGLSRCKIRKCNKIAITFMYSSHAP